jgi:hypothetical protein
VPRPGRDCQDLRCLPHFGQGPGLLCGPLRHPPLLSGEHGDIGLARSATRRGGSGVVRCCPRWRACGPGGDSLAVEPTTVQCAECGCTLGEDEAQAVRWGRWSNGVGDMYPFCGTRPAWHGSPTRWRFRKRGSSMYLQAKQAKLSESRSRLTANARPTDSVPRAIYTFPILRTLTGIAGRDVRGRGVRRSTWNRKPGGELHASKRWSRLPSAKAAVDDHGG